MNIWDLLWLLSAVAGIIGFVLAFRRHPDIYGAIALGVFSAWLAFLGGGVCYLLLLLASFINNNT